MTNIINRDLACLLFVTFIVYSFGNESVFDNLHQSCAVLAIKSLWETQDVQFIPHLIRFHFLPFPLNSIRICPALSLFPPADNLSPVSLHYTDRVQLVGSLMTWCSISTDHLCNQIKDQINPILDLIQNICDSLILEEDIVSG